MHKLTGLPSCPGDPAVPGNPFPPGTPYGRKEESEGGREGGRNRREGGRAGEQEGGQTWTQQQGIRRTTNCGIANLPLFPPLPLNRAGLYCQGHQVFPVDQRRSHDNYMAITWHSHGNQKTFTLWSPDIHMVTWHSHGNHMTVTWWSQIFTLWSHDIHMVTWHSHDNHMTLKHLSSRWSGHPREALPPLWTLRKARVDNT